MASCCYLLDGCFSNPILICWEVTTDRRGYSLPSIVYLSEVTDIDSAKVIYSPSLLFAFDLVQDVEQ